MYICCSLHVSCALTLIFVFGGNMCVLCTIARVQSVETSLLCLGTIKN